MDRRSTAAGLSFVSLTLTQQLSPVQVDVRHWLRKCTESPNDQDCDQADPRGRLYGLGSDLDHLGPVSWSSLGLSDPFLNVLMTTASHGPIIRDKLTGGREWASSLSHR